MTWLVLLAALLFFWPRPVPRKPLPVPHRQDRRIRRPHGRSRRAPSKTP